MQINGQRRPLDDEALGNIWSLRHFRSPTIGMTAFLMAEHMGGLTFDPPLGSPGYSRMLAPDWRPHRTADGHICIPASGGRRGGARSRQ